MNLTEMKPVAVRTVLNHQATQDLSFPVETIFILMTYEAEPGTEKEGPIFIYIFNIPKVPSAAKGEKPRCHLISVVKYVPKLGGISNPLEMSSTASSHLNLGCERMQSLLCLTLILTQISFFLPRLKLNLAIL